jgi:hypothetical protein
MKVCSKCKVEKHFNEFSKDNQKKNGFVSSCKVCVKKYYESRKETISTTMKIWRENNKEKMYDYNKLYYKLNKEKIHKQVTKYYEDNKEKIIQQRNKYRNTKLKQDHIFKFSYNVRSLVYHSFKRGKNQFKKNAKTEQILGCTIEEFRSYIESKFTEGMTIENHGEWHLDHIIPLASAKTEEEILKLNHYTNFQPLWAKDNLSKGSKNI